MAQRTSSLTLEATWASCLASLLGFYDTLADFFEHMLKRYKKKYPTKPEKD